MIKAELNLFFGFSIWRLMTNIVLKRGKEFLINLVQPLSQIV